MAKRIIMVTKTSPNELKELWLQPDVAFEGIKDVIFPPNPDFPTIASYVIAQKYGEDLFIGIQSIDSIGFADEALLKKYSKENHFWELLAQGMLYLGDRNIGPYTAKNHCPARLMARHLCVDHRPELGTLLTLSQSTHINGTKLPSIKHPDESSRKAYQAILQFNPVTINRLLQQGTAVDDFEKMGLNISLIANVCLAHLVAEEIRHKPIVEETVEVGKHVLAFVKVVKHSRMSDMPEVLEANGIKATFIVSIDRRNRFTIIGPRDNSINIVNVVACLRGAYAKATNKNLTTKEMERGGVVKNVPELDYDDRNNALLDKSFGEGLYGKHIKKADVVAAFKFAFSPKNEPVSNDSELVSQSES